ncbi:MAG: hypothetical protein AB7D27_11675 [Desulfomicrobium sp.]
MISKYEKLLGIMSSCVMPDVKVAYVARYRSEKDRIDHIKERLLADGYEVVNTEEPITQDGRAVLHIGRESFALTKEEHKNRLDSAFKAKETDTVRDGTEIPGEALASVLCPACRAVMAKEPVCPNCSKGQAGFKILCICTECSRQVYL